MAMEDFKSVYRSNSAPFLNADCLFVEFMDTIAAPWFTILRIICNAKELQRVYPFKEFTKNDIGEMIEWYINRKDRNIFRSLLVYSNAQIPEDFPENVLKEMETCHEDIFYKAPMLNIHNVIFKLLHDNGGNTLSNAIAKKIVIYTENEIPFLPEFLKKEFNNSSLVHYVHGDIKECLEDIPANSTYIFSDIKKINVLKAMNKLNFSSIILPMTYRYNYKKENPNELLINIDELHKEYTFKFDLIDVFDTSE